MGSSTTTRNFGFRRFPNLVRDGRHRAPLDADLRLGTFVEVDPANTDYVRAATDAAIGGGEDVRLRFCGVLWYEHDAQTLEGNARGTLAQDFDFAPRGRLVQVCYGKGAKIWLRNTEQNATERGLSFPNTRDAVTMVDGLTAVTPSVAVDDLLGWDDSNNWYTATSNASEAILRVTQVDAENLRIDAEFLI